MPKLGTIVKGTEIGYKDIHAYIWSACVDCGREKWIVLYGGKPRSLKCHHCASKGNPSFGENNPNWKGGKSKHGSGYIRIWVDKDSPFAPMRGKRGYIREHRLVMAQHLGRCLEKWEFVHHINGTRDDNKIENLQLLPSQTEHLLITLLTEENEKLREEIKRLRKELIRPNVCSQSGLSESISPPRVDKE